MKITNKYNLPDAIVRAVTNDPYLDSYNGRKADISATRLIAPARLVALQKKHADEIEEDVSDRIWSLLGTAVHHVIERATSDSDRTEERMFEEIGGWTIAGQFDLLSDGTLYDYKVTSVWSVLDGAKDDWVNQLNILDYLVGGVDKLAIIAILKDWSWRRVKGNYPKEQVVEIPIPQWSREEQKAYILERIRKHQIAQDILSLGGEPAICIDRWQRPDVYAVMKEGRKSAVKLCDTEKDAQSRVDNLSNKHYVQFRKGEAVRCDSRYCNVSKFCIYKEQKDGV